MSNSVTSRRAACGSAPRHANRMSAYRRGPNRACLICHAIRTERSIAKREDEHRLSSLAVDERSVGSSHPRISPPNQPPLRRRRLRPQAHCRVLAPRRTGLVGFIRRRSRVDCRSCNHFTERRILGRVLRAQATSLKNDSEGQIAVCPCRLSARAPPDACQSKRPRRIVHDGLLGESDHRKLALASGAAGPARHRASPRLYLVGLGDILDRLRHRPGLSSRAGRRLNAASRRGVEAPSRLLAHGRGRRGLERPSRADL